MNEFLFLGCQAGPMVSGRPVVLGCPLDVTSTYRRGAAEAPQAIRAASDSIETYSPLLDSDLSDAVFCDTGDIALHPERGRTVSGANRSKSCRRSAPECPALTHRRRTHDYSAGRGSLQEGVRRFLRHPPGRAFRSAGRVRREFDEPRDGHQTSRGYYRAPASDSTGYPGRYARGVPIGCGQTEH